MHVYKSFVWNKITISAQKKKKKIENIDSATKIILCPSIMYFLKNKKFKYKLFKKKKNETPYNWLQRKQFFEYLLINDYYDIAFPKQTKNHFNTWLKQK